MKFSFLTQEIRPAKSIEINQKVYDLKRQGKDIITLSLGEAFFELPHLPFEYDHYETGFHYSDTVGKPDLRKKISSYYNENYQSFVSPEKIIISCGSKPLTLLGMMATLNIGDNVLLHEPAWLSYEDQAKIIRASVNYFPYHKKITDFANYIVPSTKLVVLNNPNNPRGLSYSKKDLESIYRICVDKDITLMVDEAYSDFVGEDKFVSLAQIDPSFQNGIVVNSLSKNFGMSGFRLGYAITNEKMLRSLTTLNQHIITCAPTILQNYVTTYFDEFLEITKPQIADTINKRQRIKRYMEAIGLETMSGNSTFYYMVNIGGFPGGSEEFAKTLLEDHYIAVVPGIAYGPNLDRFVRVGIGSEPIERIEQALFVIRAKANG